MKKDCKECGIEIDLTGLEDFAALLKYCDACGEKVNQEIDEKQRTEREDAAREHRVSKTTREWEKTVPLLYRKTDVNHANYPKGLHTLALSWVSGNLEDEKKLPWLGIVGVSGKGKTRVMSQIVRNRIWNACRCEWVNATQFQWCAQNQHDKNDGRKAKAHIEKFRKCDFLAFDDLGKQKWTNTVESYFWDLIEERYANCRPMIWTSNSSLEKLEAMLTEDRAKAIIGRLAENSNIVEL